MRNSKRYLFVVFVILVPTRLDFDVWSLLQSERVKV
jgi:hypothetical protein